MQITLGDDGAILKGTVRLETPPPDGETLNISGNLTGMVSDSSAEQTTAPQPENFAVAVGADNTFTIDSVPPGIYSLNLQARKSSSQPWTGKPVAQGQTTITVPDDATPTSPINVGEILLQPAAQ